jgi:acyl transferase domain-containing protein
VRVRAFATVATGTAREGGVVVTKALNAAVTDGAAGKCIISSPISIHFHSSATDFPHV